MDYKIINKESNILIYKENRPIRGVFLYGIYLKDSDLIFMIEIKKEKEEVLFKYEVKYPDDINKISAIKSYFEGSVKLIKPSDEVEFYSLDFSKIRVFFSKEDLVVFYRFVDYVIENKDQIVGKVNSILREKISEMTSSTSTKEHRCNNKDSDNDDSVDLESYIDRKSVV